MGKNRLNFITEIASTHNGKFNIVENIFRKHIKTDSDFIKLQIINSNFLYKKGTKKNVRFKKLELPKDKIEKLINNYYKKTKIILELFDQSTFEYVIKFKNKVDIKISCSEADNVDFVLKILKNFKKVFLNFSGYNLNEINKLLNKYKKFKSKLVILYGFQGYPCEFYDLRLSLFDKFKKEGYQFGYSDHTLFKNYSELKVATSIAISKGAQFIEKHVCLNQKLEPPDYITALEFKKLENYILYSKKLFQELNSKKIRMSNAEKKYHDNMRKFLNTNGLKKEDKYLRLVKSQKKRI